MALSSKEVAIQSARLGLCRLGLLRLGAVLTPDELTTDSSLGSTPDYYIWSEDESDIDTVSTWSEESI